MSLDGALWQPINAATQTIAGTTTSASITLTATGNVIEIVNTGVVPIHYRLTNGASTALTTDCALNGPGSVRLARTTDGTTLSVRTASSTATVYVNFGFTS